MRKRTVLTCGVLASGLWVASALATESGSASAAPAQGEEAAAAQAGAPGEQVGVAGVVPQAQIDINKKREEARKRRDEAQKVRAQMLQSGQ